MFRYVCLAALCFAATPAWAGELSPLEAESIDIGGFHGIVFYTNDHDAYRVVATFVEGENGLPVRFEASLAEAQKISISVPGKLGEQTQVVEILPAAGKLIVAAAHTTEELVVAGPVGTVQPTASGQRASSP